MIRRLVFIGALWHLSMSGGFIIVIPYFVVKSVYVVVRSGYRGVTRRWFPETYEKAIHANVSSHSDWEGFGNGKRRSLDGRLRRALLQHVPTAAPRSLASFSLEERPSNYPGANSDFVVFDQNDRPAYFGRRLAGHRITFWSA